MSATQAQTKTRARKAKHDFFGIYISKLLKNMDGEVGISGDATVEVDLIIKYIVDKLVRAINILVDFSGKMTISAKTVQTAANLVLPGNLATFAVDAGTKAVAAYLKAEGGDKSTRSQRANLVLSISRVEKLLIKHKIARRKSAPAGVYLTAVVEFVLREILTLAVQNARDAKRTRIKPRMILLAIRNDPELSSLFKENHTILPGGVLPMIHSVLIPHRKEKNEEKE